MFTENPQNSALVFFKDFLISFHKNCDKILGKILQEKEKLRNGPGGLHVKSLCVGIRLVS